jgi:hypothetical protein
LWQAKRRHGEYFNAFAADLYWAVNTGTNGDTNDGKKPYHLTHGCLAERLATRRLASRFAVSLIFLLIGWGLKRTGDPQMVFKGKFFVLTSIAGFGLSMVPAVGNGAAYMQVHRAVARHDYQVVEGTRAMTFFTRKC